jgi:hypothetical protein
LEPLKKKIDHTKKPDDAILGNFLKSFFSQFLDGQTSIDRNSTSQQQVRSERSQSNPMNIEIQPHQPALQSKEYQPINNLNFVPQEHSIDPMQKPFIQPQRLQPTPMQAPAMMYQGYIPAGQLNPGGSIVILNPYMMAQPSMGYSYRPMMANVVPLNASFVPFPQGNITIMNQSNMVGGPYFVPLQPMNLRGPMGQNLSTNYNTVNNNVFNSYAGASGMINDNTSPSKLAFLESVQMQPELINHDQNINNNAKLRQKPELDGVFQTTKHLHKDDAKDQG